MPIYEYRCDDCEGLTAKLVRGFDAPESIACRECRGENTHRIISSVAFHKSLNSRLQDLDPSATTAWRTPQPQARPRPTPTAS